MQPQVMQMGTTQLVHTGAPGVVQPGGPVLVQGMPAPHSVPPRDVRAEARAFPNSALGKLLFWFCIVEIIIGALAIVFDAVSLSLVYSIDFSTSGSGFGADGSYYGYRTYYYIWPSTFVGSGIWSGCWVILSASFGAAAGRSQKNKCLIITHMVLSIITAVEVWSLIIAASVAISLVQGLCLNSYSSGAHCPESHYWTSVHGLQVCTLVCGLFIFIFSIVTSSFACKAVCCCGRAIVNRGYGAPQAYVVTHQAQPQNLVTCTTTNSSSTVGGPAAQPLLPPGGQLSGYPPNQAQGQPPVHHMPPAQPHAQYPPGQPQGQYPPHAQYPHAQYPGAGAQAAPNLHAAPVQPPSYTGPMTKAAEAGEDLGGPDAASGSPPNYSA